jgi:hypothetical protein
MASYAYGLDHKDTQCLVSTAGRELAAGKPIIDYFVEMAGTKHFLERAQK